MFNANENQQLKERLMPNNFSTPNPRELCQLVNTLILLQQEGEYWDFKEQWYSQDKKGDMLHDIICMANNPTGKDGLIIIGVKDSDKAICGVENDTRRLTTQNLVDFLQDKQFHGDNRPYVQVVPIRLQDHILDVIKVIATPKVPYILKSNYQGVFSNHIYSRVGDHNIPKNKSADIMLQELLWRRHFGLDLSPLERMFLYLEDKEGWEQIDEESISTRVYYRQHPEFVVEQRIDSDRDGFEVFLTGQCDLHPIWGWYSLYYFQTKIATYQTALLDGGRATVPTPNSEFLENRNIVYSRFEKHYRYRFYIVGSPKWIIFQSLWEDKRIHSEESIAIRQLFRLVLVFNSIDEKQHFDEYLDKKFSEKYLENIKNGYFDNQVSDPEAFQPEYKFYIYCVRLLEEFRHINGLSSPEYGFVDTDLVPEYFD